MLDGIDVLSESYITKDFPFIFGLISVILLLLGLWVFDYARNKQKVKVKIKATVFSIVFTIFGLA